MTTMNPLSKSASLAPSRRSLISSLLVLGLLTGLSARAASAPTGNSSGNSAFLDYGPIEFRPHLVYSGSYNDGLLVRQGAPLNTYIDAFSPGFLLKLGDRWSVDYTPTWAFYSNPAFRDTLGHAVNATGGVAYGNTSLGFKQTYTSTSDSLVETGRQTDTEMVGTEATATHVLGPRLGLHGGLVQKLTFVSASPDFYEWSAFGILQSRVSDALTASAALRSGYAAVIKFADMVYAQPGGEIRWSPTTRLSFAGSVSLDYRALLTRRWTWTENLLFGGSFRYEPFSTTNLLGKVDRTIAPSMFDGQTADATRWSISGAQRFLGRFWLSGEVNYDYMKYLTKGRSTGIARRDHVWTYRAAFRTSFLKRGGLVVSYQDTDNNSNVEGYGLKSSRIGCEVSWRY